MHRCRIKAEYGLLAGRSGTIIGDCPGASNIKAVVVDGSPDLHYFPEEVLVCEKPFPHSPTSKIFSLGPQPISRVGLPLEHHPAERDDFDIR